MANHDLLLKQEKKRQKCEENYQELKAEISKKVGITPTNKYFLAYNHIINMENTIETQKKKLEEHEKFFKLMKKLIKK